MKFFYRSALIAAGAAFIFNASAQDVQTSSENTSALRAFNPAVSVIVDTYLYADDSEEGMSHVKEEMAGFGHSHGDDNHDHGSVENGFNLRHLELAFSAEIDNYLKALAIVAVSENSAEIEVAEVETTSLPWGLQAKAGKFFSDFGYINARHAHQWSFSDQPLVYELMFGAHGLNEKGAQLTWLAPTPFYLLFGAEVFQGENEKMFSTVSSTNLPSHNGPRLGVGWVKCAPLQLENHELQLGLFAGNGKHQEAHDGDEDGTNDHWLDGDSSFWGCDAVYKYNSNQSYGQGDLVVQAEYIGRKVDLTVEEHFLNGAMVGRDKINEQDGFYAQATYGILPRWRAGLRYEMVGLTNSEQTPPGGDFEYGDSWRTGAMVDFFASEFSMLRFQVNNGDYETEDGTENVWEGFVQLTVSLGAHGAHDF